MKSLLINEIEDTNNFNKKKKEEGVKDERTTDVPSQYILGTLRKYDGVTGTATGTSKNNRFYEQIKQQLCTRITLFCTFLCRPCTTSRWSDQVLSWLEDGNGKAINFTLSLSLWTRTRFLLFISNLSFLLSSNWVTWYKGAKVSNDTKSSFQLHFIGVAVVGS